MTYTCIIIDDEPRICRLVQKLGNWTEYGIEVLGTYFDGESAFQAILEKQPDIVVSDIRIPIYDGLQLLEKTRDAGIPSLFIISSGFAQFDYAQRAIQFGTVDYLVKPINREKLNNALEKSIRQLESRNDAKAAIEDLEDIRNDHFWDLLAAGTIHISTPEEFRKEFSIPWEVKNYRMIAIQIARPELFLSDQNFYKDMFMDMLSNVWSTHQCHLDEQKGCCFILSFEDKHALNQKLSHVYTELTSFENTVGPFHLAVGYSSLFHSPETLQKAYTQAFEAMRYTLDASSNPIREWKPVERPVSRLSGLLSTQEVNRVKYLTGNLSEAEVCNYVSSLFEQYINLPSHSFRYLPEDVAELLKAIRSSLSPESGRIIDDAVKRLPFCGTFTQIRNEAISAIKKALAHDISSAEHRLSVPVNRIRAYIDAHYQDDLSLNQLGEMVNLSPAYVSSIFKKENGIGISEYLTKVRCEHAKRLLSSTTLKTDAIAAECGYSDEKYFLRQFKKTVGITPGQYRRIHSYD